MSVSSILLSLSIALLAGLLLSRLAKLVHLPAVTAYLIAGILVGPFVLGQIGAQGIGFTSLEEIMKINELSEDCLPENKMLLSPAV